ncbi:hypothetical protein [Sulfuricurvum sp.]|uniref:hypothetical protein n=1 Tax=Sulfuricurvum sp. TaxID=2025608 RepID=UPI002618F8E2|nr:hypothetical protein [Sulfuricurvum sp.]MDD2782342.1 hypothetical protein [Sulfuricurvum sp.]
MKLKTILAATLLTTTLIHADPSPFGLEIGKSTVSMMKEKYSSKFVGINNLSQGDVYDLDPSELGIEGMQSARVIYDKNGKLMGVFTTFPKGKFQYLFGQMKSKYKLVTSNIPYVGDTSAKLTNGNTEIQLNAPHMSFEMELNYVDKNLLKIAKQKSSNDAQQKSKHEASQL